MRALVAGGFMGLVLLCGCGATDEAEPTPSSVTATPSAGDRPSSPAGRESSPGGRESSPGGRESSPGGQKSRPLVSVSYANGQVMPPPAIVEAEVGSDVTIQVTSDVAEELHVHGYDKVADLEPGQSATLTFLADIPGKVEVELEGSGTLLFELRVQ
jgi:hypothetical protein